MSNNYDKRCPIVAIIQARMGSQRLPGKVLMRAGGRSLLEWHIMRLQQAKLIDKIIVATTDNQKDDVIAQLCFDLDIEVFRGSENNVLNRYLMTATKAKAITIIRTTADCPLIDPGLVDYLVEYYIKHEWLDYACLDMQSLPNGLSCEIFSYKALSIAANLAEKDWDIEHVTPFIYNHPLIFKIAKICPDIKAGKLITQYRWSVDEAADFAFIEHILYKMALNPYAGWQDIVALCEFYPEWVALNKNVRQKLPPKII